MAVSLGFRCTACGLTAVYGDWKNEYNGYQELLAKCKAGAERASSPHRIEVAASASY
ncbi:hypothetical protein [Schlesneria paludicola]|uniref:hypothetical protein n=1 Tax=Schlesneria paludicola TaxID=360056 RepID=UPI0002FC5A99|nr:hypothetical protein [Schlesneria paludicola]